MRKSNIAIGTALFSTLLLSAPSVLAQSFPQLYQGMPYSEARQLLLDEGWQAVFNLEQVNNSDPSSRVTHFLDLGYTEIIDCAGAGLGLCAFEFQDNEGETLSISVAQGEETDVVFGWQIEE